ncbi:hypothetical protein Barb6XT_03218 [Bacteroidales bacterium Barb6XT]|nr:hypothetical protein Barb6XT_03218 [Bacteroidales bacterium Barb6XT]
MSEKLTAEQELRMRCLELAEKTAPNFYNTPLALMSYAIHLYNYAKEGVVHKGIFLPDEELRQIDEEYLKMIFNRVDLPLPLFPTRAAFCPLTTEKLTVENKSSPLGCI